MAPATRASASARRTARAAAPRLDLCGRQSRRLGSSSASRSSRSNLCASQVSPEFAGQSIPSKHGHVLRRHRPHRASLRPRSPGRRLARRSGHLISPRHTRCRRSSKPARSSRRRPESSGTRPQQEPASRWSAVMLPDLDAEAPSSVPRGTVAAAAFWRTDSLARARRRTAPIAHERQRAATVPLSRAHPGSSRRLSRPPAVRQYGRSRQALVGLPHPAIRRELACSTSAQTPAHPGCRSCRRSGCQTSPSSETLRGPSCAAAPRASRRKRRRWWLLATGATGACAWNLSRIGPTASTSAASAPVDYAYGRRPHEREQPV